VGRNGYDPKERQSGDHAQKIGPLALEGLKMVSHRRVLSFFVDGKKGRKEEREVKM
jgi:hypothetical protein